MKTFQIIVKHERDSGRAWIVPAGTPVDGDPATEAVDVVDFRLGDDPKWWDLDLVDALDPRGYSRAGFDVDAGVGTVVYNPPLRKVVVAARALPSLDSFWVQLGGAQEWVASGQRERYAIPDSAPVQIRPDGRIEVHTVYGGGLWLFAPDDEVTIWRRA